VEQWIVKLRLPSLNDQLAFLIQRLFAHTNTCCKTTKMPYKQHFFLDLVLKKVPKCIKMFRNEPMAWFISKIQPPVFVSVCLHLHTTSMACCFKIVLFKDTHWVEPGHASCVQPGTGVTGTRDKPLCTFSVCKTIKNCSHTPPHNRFFR
jgi:hypothetical protein